MALTEEKIIDKIEVVGDYYHIQVREAHVIKRDGVEISKRYWENNQPSTYILSILFSLIVSIEYL